MNLLSYTPFSRLVLGYLIASVLTASAVAQPLDVSFESSNQGKNLADVVPTGYDICVNNLLFNGNDTLTLGEIRARCAEAKVSDQPLSKRRLNEVLTEKNPFVLTPHRLNYALLGYYVPKVNEAPFEAESGEELRYQDLEMQFQLSFKFPIIKQLELFNNEIDVYAAYTNRSFWQVFDDKDSIPFRETNHEPELWAEIHADLDFFDYNLHKVLLGVNHQSNGQSETLSRGWNRVFVQALLQADNSYLSFKTWQRFEETDKFDNSFDYQKYLGDFEVEGVYKWDEHSFGITARNRYNLNEYGSMQLDYTYPLTKRLKGYVQVFRGYGDSLIDLDHHTNKFGVGIVLADRI